MKLQEPNNQEIVIGGGEHKMFGIDTSTPIIFEILRNKMYSNKLGAIAREIASNSRDANRESGTDKPVQIEFTNSSEYMLGDVSIIFRDFGIGISPERIDNIFLMYGASTKRDSNIMTGGFGLGAKTPFAYTDSFLIRTVNEGTEYIYNAIIDQTGKGKMIPISENETDRESGTEITIPILSSSDRAKLEMEIYKSTSHWTNVEYINFFSEKPEVSYIIDEKDYKITKYNGWANYVGLVDGIPYEIKPTNAASIPGFTVMFNLDLDSITINANRESLQYDEKTENHINFKVEQMKAHLKEKIETYLADSKTYKEAFLKIKVLKREQSGYTFNHLLHVLKSQRLFGINYNVTLNGEQVESIKFKYHSVDYVRYDSRTRRVKYESSSVNLELPVVYLDSGRLSALKNQELDKFLFIRPIKGNPQELIKEEFDKLMEITEGDYIKYSEVKIPAGKSSPSARRNYLTFKVRNLEKIGISAEIYFDKESKTFKSGNNIAFIPIWSITKTPKYLSDSDKYKLQIIKHTLGITNVYYVNETSFSKHLAPAGFKTFSETWKKVDLSKFSKYLDITEITNVLNKFPKLITDNFPELLPKSYALLKSEKTKIPESLSGVNWRNVGVKESPFDYFGVYNKFTAKMRLNYPMLLPYVQYGKDTDEEKIKNIKEYIKR